MTLQNIVDILKAIGNSQPNIRTTTEGSVYDKLNTNNHIEYDVFHISQTTHREDEDRNYYGFNLFYISRLEDSLEDNRLQIQSIGKEVLSNIIRNLCAEWSIDFPDITYIPFTQRFADLCAGVYCTIQLDVPKEIWCEDDYISSVIPGKDIKLQDLGVTITQNGLRVFTPGAEYDGIGEIRIDVQVPQSAGVFEDKEVTYTNNGVYTVYPDNGYDAMTSVQVEVDVPDLYEEGYAAGEVAGEENQKAKLVSTSITENNTYTREDGYSAVTVNVPSRYDEGKADGIAEQKAKLSALTVTINGDYTREDGYSAITVNVPQSGQTINNQSKSYEFNSGNTQITQSVGGDYYLYGGEIITPDSGYTGLDRVTASCLADITALYDSGYTAGTEAGFVSGTTYQKSLLTSTSFTENNTYTLENGWSSVTINVPQTGGTDRDLIANLQGDYFLIPEGTTRLRGYAFYNCCFSSITIPNTVTTIGEGAFYNNRCLTNITIPNSVGYINNFAFLSCTGLTAMTFERLQPAILSANYPLGNATADTFPIYVPCESVEAYKTANIWSQYAHRIQCAPDYITSLELVVDSAITNSGQASVITSPSGVGVNIHYISSDPTKATIDENGVITVYEDGIITITAYDSISGLEDSETVTVSIDSPRKAPIGFTILSNGNIVWKATSSYTATIQYKKNNGEWTNITSSLSGSVIPVQVGDVVLFRGDNLTYCRNDATIWGNVGTNTFCGTTAQFEVSGNIMSLINSTGYPSLNVIECAYTFTDLFGKCDTLLSAENLILPATTLKNNCYIGMFEHCTNMTKAPLVLPATRVSDNAYRAMFYGCTSLTATPIINAEVLGYYACSIMFTDCTSLVTAPALSATTLAENCYEGMFAGCTSLTGAPELPATTLAQSCYTQMFAFCTSLTAAPELPASTLMIHCYESMFEGCTNLNYIKCLATDISASYCTYDWVSGVSPSGTFVKAVSADWSVKTGAAGIPSGWGVQNDGV